MIRYRDGYKYQLAEDYSVTVAIRPPAPIDTEYISLTTEGVLTVRKGYAWDGPSGPTFDTRSSMRPSLVHDALYQLLREGRLPQEYRILADEELYRLALEDGMWRWRAWLWRRELGKFAAGAADPSNSRMILVAP